MHDQIEDMDECEQSTVRVRTCEDSSGTSDRLVESRRSRQTVYARNLIQYRRQNVTVSLVDADMSSNCTIQRTIHKDILTSTTELTTALHEKFVKSVSSPDKTKLLFTLRQRLTDLKEFGIQRNSDATCTKSQIYSRRTMSKSCTLPLNVRPLFGV